MNGGNGPSSDALGESGSRRVHNCGGTSASKTSIVSSTTIPITSIANRFSCFESGVLKRTTVQPFSYKITLAGTKMLLANSRTRYAGDHKGAPHATPPLSPLRIRMRNPDQSHLILQHQNAAYRIVNTLHTNVPCVYRLVYALDHCGDILGCRCSH
jgi:hypothetical protein